jgi:hypothetical protein
MMSEHCEESPLMNKKWLMNNLRHYQNYLIMNAIKATLPLEVVLLLCLTAFMRIKFSEEILYLIG